MAAIVPASVWHPLAHTATFEDESAERAMKKVSFFCSPDVSVLSSFSLIISPPPPISFVPPPLQPSSVSPLSHLLIFLPWTVKCIARYAPVCCIL